MAFPKRRNLQEQKRQKLVIVGSKNPVKIKSTENAFSNIFDDSFIVQGLNVDSKVSAQPMGDVETYTGAYNRAFASKNAFPEADFWVGIEGGVDHVGEQMVAFAWMVILNNENTIGKAKTASFFLPEAINKMVSEGMELGEADEASLLMELSAEQIIISRPCHWPLFPSLKRSSINKCNDS